MDIEGGEYTNKKTFLSHVFVSTEEGKAEIFNSVQYSFLAIIPIVILNKLIQRFIPEPDLEKGSFEILLEILIQLSVLIVGIIIIHRIITYIPTYSGFKYESFSITTVILAFMIIILSLQTKIGIKTNILFERIMDLWNGTTDEKKQQVKKNVRVSGGISEGMMSGMHTSSQADHLDTMQPDMFPPAPLAPKQQRQVEVAPMLPQEPIPANFAGSPFGSY